MKDESPDATDAFTNAKTDAGIQRMGESDLTQVVKLEEDCGLNSRGVESYRRLLSDPHAVLLVAVNAEREVIGLLSATVVVDELQIDNVAVVESWRRRGIASKLLAAGLQDAARKGARQAVLELRSANAAARALYQRHAFVVTGNRPNYYRNPPDQALIMSCQIGPSHAKHPIKNFEADPKR